MNDNVRMAASSIGNRVGAIGNASVESVISIIMLVLPLLPSLMQLCGGNKSAKQLAASHYDEHTGTFDRRAIQRLFPELRQAQAKHNAATGENVRLSRQDLKRLATETLREAMEADEETVVGVLAMAAQTPTED